MDHLISSAQAIDLDRRLRNVELALGGSVQREYDADTLASLYIHAAKAQPVTLRDAVLWGTVVRGLTVENLAALAKAIRDPFPWRPFLTRLDHLEAAGVIAVRPATAYLLELARGLLRAQGFGDLVQVRDILAAPTATQAALRAISAQKEPRHDQRLRRRNDPKAQRPRSRP